MEPKSIDRIFWDAGRIDSAAEREAYLQGACAGDVELRERVEQLLQATSKAESFFRSVCATQHIPSEPPLQERAGMLIGPYQLCEQIGEGGFGVVYVAEQTQPVHRKVALKLIKPGMDTKQVIARFEAERQALALMDHPNIAKVFDAGTTDSGRPYFVMELVRGVPVTDYCDQCNLTTRERLELFVAVCQAVQHAHQKGVIHRDLKPTNVLVSMQDGRAAPKIIDFGVAKAINQRLTEHTLATGFAQMLGTPLYMSPEQAELSPLGVDTRTDIYSLGVLLYELLTGATPFERERLQTASFDELRRIIREEEPPRPSARISTLAADLAATVAERRRTDTRRLLQALRGDVDCIVTKALEKDRNRRYASANSLAQDVEHYLNGEPVLARPASRAYLLRKFVERNRGPVLSACLVLLALVGGIIGTTWGMIRATTAEAVAVHEANQKEAALRASLQSERNARDKLWQSLYDRARAGRYSRQMGQRLGSLAALSEAARLRPDAGLRDEAIAAMALPDVRRIPGGPAPGSGDSVTAVGTQYKLWARADAQGNISIRNILDGKEIQRIASGPIAGPYLHFSPDDRFLLRLSPDYSLGVWRVADGQRALRDELPRCRTHAFSPEGRCLAVGQDEWVLCFDLATGEEVNRWPLPAPARALAFHPDNGQLAVGYSKGAVASVYDSSGALIADLPVGAMSHQVIAWHPDGARLAVAGHDPVIQIWNVAAKRKVATLEGHAQYVEAVTFHPRGQLMASYSWDGVLRLWEPATGKPLLRVPLRVADRPRFSGDGRWLAAALQGLRVDLLEVTANSEYRTLVSSEGAGQGGYGLGDISPDGRLLLVGMNEGARVWDLRNGRELAALPAGAIYASFDGPAHSTRDPTNEDGGGAAILTCGPGGLERWPITSEGRAGQHLRLGPPRKLAPLHRASFARSLDGRTIGAVTDGGRVNQIVDLQTGAVRRNLGSHPSGAVTALSGDGRWAASCGWHSDRVRLWNARTGAMVHEWVTGRRTGVYFSPDSQALVIARIDEFSFWDVNTLQPIRRIARDVADHPGWVAFSPDGRLMALELAPAVIHLKEVATGRTVVRLEDPHGDRASWQGFTPDGAQLVVVAKYARAIHIWDLPAIRKRLKDMNLDWDWPELSPAEGSPHAQHEGYTIEVVPSRTES